MNSDCVKQPMWSIWESGLNLHAEITKNARGEGVLENKYNCDNPRSRLEIATVAETYYRQQLTLISMGVIFMDINGWVALCNKHLRAGIECMKLMHAR